jgi:hypothetical protein
MPIRYVPLPRCLPESIASRRNDLATIRGQHRLRQVHRAFALRQRGGCAPKPSLKTRDVSDGFLRASAMRFGNPRPVQKVVVVGHPHDR